MLFPHLRVEWQLDPKWSHEDVTAWAQGDPKTPKRVQAKGVLFPTITMTETEMKNGRGRVRAIVNDVFSYSVKAKSMHPNILKIFGIHQAPQAGDLPEGTIVKDEAPQGPWERTASTPDLLIYHNPFTRKPNFAFF